MNETAKAIWDACVISTQTPVKVSKAMQRLMLSDKLEGAIIASKLIYPEAEFINQLQNKLKEINR